jgi:hypothetical protein
MSGGAICLTYFLDSWRILDKIVLSGQVINDPHDFKELEYIFDSKDSLEGRFKDSNFTKKIAISALTQLDNGHRDLVLLIINDYYEHPERWPSLPNQIVDYVESCSGNAAILLPAINAKTTVVQASEIEIEHIIDKCRIDIIISLSQAFTAQELLYNGFDINKVLERPDITDTIRGYLMQYFDSSESIGTRPDLPYLKATHP